jgi:hypothetical protein
MQPCDCAHNKWAHRFLPLKTVGLLAEPARGWLTLIQCQEQERWQMFQSAR